ncbi:hypothetical protein [Pseudanabaena sp. PCC 6802]|uniref:hypothetical protein n=1 Tax=Pseudanabaena sp. PCC 6802 TaxID=118173 RepID=UPI000348A97A|nr:hypothetical protein [Pseudanabaena sp. PCC 6802]
MKQELPINNIEQAPVSSLQPLPARKMHKIVFAFMGLFTAIAVTYPIAMWRVSQMDKFRGFHVKSLSDNLRAPANEVTGTKATPK